MSRKPKFQPSESVRKPLSPEQLYQKARKQPRDIATWQTLVQTLLKAGKVVGAHEAVCEALGFLPEEPGLLEWRGHVEYRLHRPSEALRTLASVLEQKPDSLLALITQARIHADHSSNIKALKAIENAEAIAPLDVRVLDCKGTILSNLFRLEEACETFARLTEIAPNSYSHWNNLANAQRDLGRLEEADQAYLKAIRLAGDEPTAYSNRLTTLHYSGSTSREDILKVIEEWEPKYAPKGNYKKPTPLNRDPAKRLRIGMISDGFRRHPVGRMIVRCLESIDPAQVELYTYSSNDISDDLTERLRKVCNHWQPTKHMRDEELARQVQEDQIDILIDLAGHNAGTRMRVMAMQPAPLLVKWVGGLINTTGVKAIDYLISDSIETPPGEDKYYTEKLIRLPDDYIVFAPPPKLPKICSLPALDNGYVTLACFNNPTKVNNVTLKQWALIMHQLTNSRLLLKGRPYTSEAFCESIYQQLEAEGITRDRIIIEGPGSNYELLEAYNRADIALDPWPYSGGLTTCEAFIMGLPVVTRTGPTFAGRHSATHLVNAGMPELVTESWEEYRDKVFELASDLESLNVIRQHLREILLQSPVCDGPRFATHFIKAMRAIWQRYCEDKLPAALTFEKNGEGRFEGEEQPVTVAYAEPLAEGSGFSWQLPGKIVVIDNCAKLISQQGFDDLLGLNALGVVAFDPASRVITPDKYAGSKDVQLFQHAVLGSGQQAMLHACLDPGMSSVLEPLPVEQQYGSNPQGVQVIAKLPISTIALDSINGLESLDWLILDHLSNVMVILEHGENILKDTLLIQVCIPFQATHQRQPNLAELQHWMARHGFRFYRFNNEQYRSHLPDSICDEQRQATELVSADAIFLPSHERTIQLSDEQRTKLAFLLHTVFGAKDMAYKLLVGIDERVAEQYLIEEGMVEPPSEKVVTEKSASTKRKIFIVGFPKSGTSTIQKALEKTGFVSAHWKVKEGVVGELMYKGLREHDDPWYYLQCYDAITQSDVCVPSSDLNYWPNLDFEIINKIQEKHPDCLFVLNYRDPEKIISSIEKWGDFLDRLKAGSVPGLDFDEDDDRASLRSWIVSHFDKIRSHFKDNERFIEVDISNDKAPKKLGKKLGVELAWWGVANENKVNNSSFTVPDAPHMSLAERHLFKKSLQQVGSYFEFGSGGSTVWAVREGLTAYGVESDATWVNELKRELGERCQVQSVDIGPTKEWGFPISMQQASKFPSYSQAIHNFEQAFDLILVDGRFRVACTMAAVHHIIKYSKDPSEVRIFIHDFWNRPHYHVVLQFLEVVEKVESAGLFKIANKITKKDVSDLWEKYSKQPQ